MTPQTPPSPPPLPPDYYLRNFICLLEQVVGQYEDLLLPEEVGFYRAFQMVSTDAQKLLVRLLTRKGDLFRADRLRYIEIGCIAGAAEELKKAGLVEIDPPLAAGELLPLFSKAEWLVQLPLLGYAAMVPGLAQCKRADLDAALLAVLPSPVSANATLKVTIYRLKQSQIFDVFKLLFFGNLHQDLTEFVLRDLGLYVHEPYRVDRSTRLFIDRPHIDRHLAYFQLIALLDDVLADGRESILEFYRLLPQATQEDPVLTRRVERLAYSLARQLERDGHWTEALAICETLNTAEARERRARLLAKLEQPQAALEFCRQLASSASTYSDAHFAERFGRKIARKLAAPWPIKKPYRPPQQILELPYTDCDVEFAAAAYFCNSGDCHYVENTLFTSLFGLHYWDAVFAPVRGAFTHPFQAAPHDLHQPEFSVHRAILLQEANENLVLINQRSKFYLERWRAKFGRINPFVHWSALDEELLGKALTLIPQHHWQAVFKRFWSDLRTHCAGLPDLIWFPSDGGYELIEVKGPGDRLQENQLAWMEYFAEHGIPHRVVQVSWRYD
jgi:hypothetical protein